MLYESAGDDLNSETKSLGFLMFHRVPLALANYKERRKQLIIILVWNIIFNEFLLFSIYFSCRMQNAKSRENVGALESIF